MPTKNEAAGDFSEDLLAWFDEHGRSHLPWQQQISPYRVWISEIMLQQTQVATVIPYYQRFIDRFPTVQLLAAASDDEVMHLWTGLGYYARARNLHKTAKIVAESASGTFPHALEALTDLPGIGRSTAGAIVSIACGGRAPILDGNVKRVLARRFGIDGWPGQTAVTTQLWALAEDLTPTTRVADYTQAIMDLGATVCTRSAPNCDACPFRRDCVARATDRIAELPGKKPRKTMPVRETCLLLIQNDAHELLLEKRPPQGLWGGLWSFPEVALAQLPEAVEDYDVASQQTLPTFRHTFTHFHLDITPVHVKLHRTSDRISENNEVRWCSLESPPEIGLTRPATRLIQQLLTQQLLTQQLKESPEP